MTLVMPLTEQVFVELLALSERSGLDQSRAYNLSVDIDRASLIKDVLCMANTPRSTTSYIILGVKKRPDGTTDLWGLDSPLMARTSRRSLKIAYIRIPTSSMQSCFTKASSLASSKYLSRRGPCVAVEDFPPLRGREIYIRRDSMNDVATPEETAAIVQWVQQEMPTTLEPLGNEPWTELISCSGVARLTDGVGEFQSGCSSWLEPPRSSPHTQRAYNLSFGRKLGPSISVSGPERSRGPPELTLRGLR